MRKISKSNFALLNSHRLHNIRLCGLISSNPQPIMIRTIIDCIVQNLHQQTCIQGTLQVHAAWLRASGRLPWDITESRGNQVITSQTINARVIWPGVVSRTVTSLPKARSAAAPAARPSFIYCSVVRWETFSHVKMLCSGHVRGVALLIEAQVNGHCHYVVLAIYKLLQTGHIWRPKPQSVDARPRFKH